MPAVDKGRFAGPAEYERVVWGTAKQPTREQRTIFINGVAQASLPMTEYNCDLCNDPITPGSRCCAFTAWPEGRPPIAAWESEYLCESEETCG
jgi:hypothetical protein